uniref:Macro domain-containing protein n=1 Tax=Arcella intermedia TaxID=1963864 RepID=A0A6B2LJ47_9EUKA
MKALQRLSQMMDIKNIRLSPEELKPKYPVNSEINRKISHWSGDITLLKIEAIVNAAHPGLTGGGGVDGYIHMRAGEGLRTECLGLGGCAIGEAKITKGHLLPCEYVIHTVGPCREDPIELEKCYINSLQLLVSKGLKVIAFPCISTGHYSFPIIKATQIALEATRKWLNNPQNYPKIERIIFCTYTVRDEALYEALMNVYYPTQ